MTKIIESIAVGVQCASIVEHSGSQCEETGSATIVSTVERGDLVLVPIDWSAEIEDGQIVLVCPNHKEKP